MPASSPCGRRQVGGARNHQPAASSMRGLMPATGHAAGSSVTIRSRCIPPPSVTAARPKRPLPAAAQQHRVPGQDILRLLRRAASWALQA